MSDERFSIVFRGDLEPGHSLPDVKLRLAKLFKANEDRIAKLFSGQPVVLKANIDSVTAEKYRKVLMDAGAHVMVKSELEPVLGSAEEKKRKLLDKRAEKLAAKRAAMGSAEPEASIPKEPDATPAVKQTLAERLQAQEQARSDNQNSGNIFTQSNSEKVEVARTTPGESGLALMPVGVDVLTASERDDARPGGVEVQELQVDLAPEGADLLLESERETVVPVVVDVSGLDVALQEGHLDSSDALDHLSPDRVEIPALDVAELGVSMDQEEKAPPPPPPDTSSLKLAN